jgi:hypothetical protein
MTESMKMITNMLKNIANRAEENEEGTKSLLQIQLKEVHSLEDKGMELIDALIDFQTSVGISLKKALTVFSYDPPSFDAPCEVKQSKYGRGVFAKRDIKKGEVATLYPIHAYINTDSKGRGRITGGVEYDWAYCLTHSPTKAIYQGDKDEAHPLFLGHLLNDFYPTVEDFKDKSKLRMNIVKYMLHGNAYENITFEMGKHFIMMKASKDIKEGEELLVGYSPTYWARLSTEQVGDELCALLKETAKTDLKKADFYATLIEKYYKK